MTNVVFRVDANATIGYGHFYRCLSLAQMLSEEYIISFAMADPSMLIMESLSALPFGLIELPGFVYKTPDERTPDEEMPFDMEAFLGEIQIVVLDGYWFGPAYQKALNAQEVKVVVVEDHGRGHYLADLIVNHAPGLEAAAYSTDRDHSEFALGTDYSLLRPQFLQQAKLKVALPKNIKNVLICFGGADFYGLAKKVTQWVLDHTYLEVHLISGALSLTDFSATNLENRLQLSQGLSESQMKEAMLSADFGIVPSSGILYECMACKLPVISGMFTENQAQIYHGLKKEGVFLDTADFNLDRLSQQIEALTEENIIAMIRQQTRVVDGNADKRFNNLFACLI